MFKHLILVIALIGLGCGRNKSAESFIPYQASEQVISTGDQINTVLIADDIIVLAHNEIKPSFYNASLGYADSSDFESHTNTINSQIRGLFSTSTGYILQWGGTLEEVDSDWQPTLFVACDDCNSIGKYEQRLAVKTSITSFDYYLSGTYQHNCSDLPTGAPMSGFGSVAISEDKLFWMSADKVTIFHVQTCTPISEVNMPGVKAIHFDSSSLWAVSATEIRMYNELGNQLASYHFGSSSYTGAIRAPSFLYVKDRTAYVVSGSQLVILKPF